jgi:hypothetical protein
MGFDASQVPEQRDFSALPEGQYVVIATASEEKPNSKGTGTYLQITFEVLDGPCKGRKLWARMNLKNPNQTAVEIAHRELAAICRAVGVIKPADSSELHNRPLLVTVGVEVDDKRRESNNIKRYDAVAGGTPAPVAAPAFVPQAAAAAPAFVAPTTAAVPSTAPWMR